MNFGKGTYKLAVFAKLRWTRERIWASYGIALLGCLAGLLGRFALGHHLVGAPFITFIPAIIIATIAGGAAPGLLSAAIAAALACHFFIPATGLVALWPDRRTILIAFFVISATIVIAIDAAITSTARLTRAMELLRAANDTLESRIAERTADLMAAEAALRQAQKMEAVGQLTGGIAHDFNNLLTVIDGNLELLTDPGLDEAKRRYFTDNARRGAERARLLTQQLLAFARLQPLETKIDDVNRLITRFEPIMRRALPEFIELRLDPAARPAAAAVDISQFEAALLNLTVNARDAMPNGGRLVVRTERRRVAIGNDEPECVVVSVIDDGEGIDPRNLDKIFDPFFTTKPVGKGSGLGLSQLHGFVAQLGGRVVVDSTVGMGTTISMCLPAAALDATRQAEAAPILPTILAVDDDAAVLEIAVAMLSTLKYRVLTAVDGAQALRLLSRESNIDLLFTDVAMPNGMTGIDLAREARTLLPDLKVLLTSGYPQKEKTAQFPMLKKPYSRVQLAERLQNLLNRG